MNYLLPIIIGGAIGVSVAIFLSLNKKKKNNK